MDIISDYLPMGEGGGEGARQVKVINRYKLLGIN